jgi:hypothetical protein
MMVAESEANGKKWNQEQTGEKFGLKQNTVSTYLTISEEIDRGDAKNNARISGAASLKTAHDIVQQIKERRHQAFLKQAFLNLGTQKKSETIINADFLKWAPSYTGPKFNFIHCDFPYGIDTDKRQQGTAVAVHGGYDDSPENYRRLLEALCANLNKAMHRLCTHYVLVPP